MSYSIDLSGRVALVTGASSGLGAQFARTLAKAGACVVLAGRRIERLKTLRSEIEGNGGDAHVVALDVTDLDSIKSAVAHAETEVGTIDILINNSGVSRDAEAHRSRSPMTTTSSWTPMCAAPSSWRKRWVSACWAVPADQAPGTFIGGRIVNIASMAGLRVLSQIGVYLDEQGRRHSYDARHGT